ncbi:hypothetical protein ACS0TY_032962 [Phlomoides rotata]
MVEFGGVRVEDDDSILDLGSVVTAPPNLSSLRSVIMVGKLYSKKSLNTYALIDVMVKAFNPKPKVTAREWGKNLIMFSFESMVDREWVIQNQSWHFDINLFVVKPLLRSEQPSAIEIKEVSMWVRAHDLSLVGHTYSVIRSLAVKIGLLEQYEKPTFMDPSEFVRFKVIIDVSKPLISGVKVK